jgi:hypothetical protein
MAAQQESRKQNILEMFRFIPIHTNCEENTKKKKNRTELPASSVHPKLIAWTRSTTGYHGELGTKTRGTMK